MSDMTHLRIVSVESTQRSHMDRLDALDERMDAIDNRFNGSDQKLDKILETLNMARGGLRMFLAVCTAAATVGAFISHFWHQIFAHYP